ncbi:MAG: hypothetical protein JNJ83_01940 [Verrucomicrobiaceae bacterium]|nr:hypothetical protein [Verrucomicrobiaceae bacterium]
MNAEEAEKIVCQKNNGELFAMLAHPEEWVPEVLGAAKDQLRTRGIEFTQAIPQSQPPPRRGNPGNTHRGFMLLAVMVAMAIFAQPNIENPQEKFQTLLRSQKAKIYEDGNLVTTAKRCLSCGREVPLDSQVGQTCPHCRVRWSKEVIGRADRGDAQ